ncbi:hypothetical protein CEXT_238041 [Caerostris extrusa]|uniref:Uncharacterized protein n=1 Tax=Caerostris extrusa TaxID=172846 RepID=A0AAV4UH25_CAEEX|nr:hypothetical protein CEXT_238041 [Caerostris extrusa]
MSDKGGYCLYPPLGYCLKIHLTPPACRILKCPFGNSNGQENKLSIGLGLTREILMFGGIKIPNFSIPYTLQEPHGCCTTKTKADWDHSWQTQINNDPSLADVKVSSCQI